MPLKTLLITVKNGAIQKTLKKNGAIQKTLLITLLITVKNGAIQKTLLITVKNGAIEENTANNGEETVNGAIQKTFRKHC